METRQLINSWWPTALCFGIILYATLSSDPTGEHIPLFPGADKLIHSIMFGGFFGAMSFDWYRSGHKYSRRILLLFAAISVAFGGLVELFQMAMDNGRSADFLDLIADIVGVLVAYFTAPPVIKKLIKRYE